MSTFVSKFKSFINLFPTKAGNEGELSFYLLGSIPNIIERRPNGIDFFYSIRPDVWIGEVGLYRIDGDDLYYVDLTQHPEESIDQIVKSGKAKIIKKDQLDEVLSKLKKTHYNMDAYNVGTIKLLREESPTPVKIVDRL